MVMIGLGRRKNLSGKEKKTREKEKKKLESSKLEYRNRIVRKKGKLNFKGKDLLRLRD